MIDLELLAETPQPTRRVKADLRCTVHEFTHCGLCCRSLRVHHSPPQNLVLGQSGRIAALRCVCACSGAIWRKQPFKERSNPRMLQTI
jgi:hypothetical protein